jgi:hypothetical protein
VTRSIVFRALSCESFWFCVIAEDDDQQGHDHEDLGERGPALVAQASDGYPGGAHPLAETIVDSAMYRSTAVTR